MYRTDQTTILPVLPLVQMARKRSRWCIPFAAVVAITCLLVFQPTYLQHFGVVLPPFMQHFASRESGIAAMTNVHTQRRVHLNGVCDAHRQQYMNITKGRNSNNQEGVQFLIDDTHNIVYCPVPKIGCSFWKRAFSVLDGRNKESYLFDLSGVAIHSSGAFETFGGKTFLEKYYFLRSSLKFVFVRDPYERLFSGYIDKVFIPNRMSFRLSKSMGRFRFNDTRSKGERLQPMPACTADITFSEFLSYVTNAEGVGVNDHFQSANGKCFPCHVDYDIIGKMETFHRDAEYILKSAGVDPSTVFGASSTFEKDNALSIMRDVARRSFEIISNSIRGRCLTKYSILQRTWITFQVRGYLSTNISMPLTRTQAENTTLAQLVGLLQVAYNRSGDPEVTKGQRKAAMLEAYYSVPRPLLQQVESYVKDDCNLFGYDCDVDSRFNMSNRPVPLFHYDKYLKLDAMDM